MGLKFRKSVKILPGVKLNFSSSGVSTTVGAKGLSVNINKKGTYLNMGIPGTGIYDRKKISSNNYTNENLNFPNNSVGVYKSVNNNMGVLRRILLYIQRFVAFIFIITFLIFLFQGDIGGVLFTGFIIILVDYYDFKLIKNKILSLGKTNNKTLTEDVIINSDALAENDIINNIVDDNYNDSEYDYLDNRNILKCETGEILDTQRDNDFFNKLENEKQVIYDEYGKLSIEFEEIKQFGDFDKMVDLENKIHNYFSDEILPKMLNLGLIYTIDPIKEKIPFDNKEFKTYDYIGKLVPKNKFEEYKTTLDNRLKYYKEGTSDFLYDLYAKSLRRIGNYYKQNKLWKESLNIFSIIEDMGQAGIMDKKSIIKIRKEIENI